MIRKVNQKEMTKIALRQGLKIALRAFLVEDESIECGILVQSGVDDDAETYFMPYSVQAEKGSTVNYYNYQMQEADDIFLILSANLDPSASSSGHYLTLFDQPVLVASKEGRKLNEHIAVPSSVIKFDLTDTFSNKGFVDGTWDDELWFAIKSSSTFENAEFTQHTQDVMHRHHVWFDGELRNWFFNDLYRIEIKYEFKRLEPLGNEAMLAPSLAEE